MKKYKKKSNLYKLIHHLLKDIDISLYDEFALSLVDTEGPHSRNVANTINKMMLHCGVIIAKIFKY